MADTGKLKRLFERCTKNVLLGENAHMDYYPGDLDGIAEQIRLYVEGTTKDLNETIKRAELAERRVAESMGAIRRAHAILGTMLKE